MLATTLLCVWTTKTSLSLVLTYERSLHWSALQEGKFVELYPNADGVLCSQVFPGLWLDVAAFWANDLAKILQTLQQGSLRRNTPPLSLNCANNPRNLH